MPGEGFSHSRVRIRALVGVLVAIATLVALWSRPGSALADPPFVNWAGLLPSLTDAYDPNSANETDLQTAAALMMKIRPYVRKFHSSEYLNVLASGEICLAVGFSGDIKQAQKRAAEAKNGVDIAYAIPKEGAQLWFDNLAIPRDARNVAEAEDFINYLQRPEVAAKNTNFISYANGNLASQKFIDKAILDDKGIYPDEATMRSLYTISAHDPKTQRLINRLWTRIKTGK